MHFNPCKCQTYFSSKSQFENTCKLQLLVLDIIPQAQLGSVTFGELCISFAQDDRMAFARVAAADAVAVAATTYLTIP